jgi:SH3-like domain-containing protein
MPLSITGKKQGPWIEVTDVDGQTHWANKRDVSSRMSCVVVKTNTTKLRAGPGKTFDMAGLGVVDKYSAFLDLGGEDGWTQVVDDAGEKAWVNLDHIWKPSKKLRMSFDPDK